MTYDYGDKIDSFIGLDFDYIKSKALEIDMNQASLFKSPENLVVGQLIWR